MNGTAICSVYGSVQVILHIDVGISFIELLEAA